MQKESLRLLFERLGAPLLLCDEDGEVIVASPAALALVGREPEWLADNPADTWLQGEDGLLWPATSQVVERDVFFDDADGVQRRVPAAVGALPVEGGLGWLIAFRPPSESAEKLAGLQAVLGNLARDLGETLSIVMSQTSQALLDNPPERTASALRAIYSAGRDAAILQGQIGALGRAPGKLRPCSLGALVHDTTRRLASTLGDDVQIETHLPARGDEVLADVDALRLVLLGAGEWLVRQGARRLRFQVLVGESLVRLGIAGDDPGLSAEQRQRLLRPDAADRDSSVLPLLPGIAERHGGRALVDAARGGGTTLHLEIPRARPAGAAARAQRAETVLVVEDDLDLQAVVAEMLRIQGFQVLTAANGIEASVILRQRHGELDAMLTDAVLPGRSGVELISEARTLQPDLPVLLMTSYSPDFLSGRLQQDLPCLYKPFSSSALVGRMRELIDQR